MDLTPTPCPFFTYTVSKHGAVEVIDRGGLDSVLDNMPTVLQTLQSEGVRLQDALLLVRSADRQWFLTQLNDRDEFVRMTSFRKLGVWLYRNTTDFFRPTSSERLH